MLHSFEEALSALKQGKTIKRECWDGVYLDYVPATRNTNESIQITLWNGRKVIGWNSTTDDYFAKDWLIC